jgi:hypothetical protein
MRDLLKTDSKNPGSIVTNGRFTFKLTKIEPKFVESQQLHYVHYFLYGRDLDSQYINEFNDRDSRIMSILGPEASNADVGEFSACLHDSALRNDYGKDLRELLNEINDSIK